MKKSLLTLLIALPAFAATLDGEYEVPAPSDLKALANFQIKYKVETVGQTRTIGYKLPDDITGGQRIIITLKETGITKEGLATFSDPQAKATCLDNIAIMTCVVKYQFELNPKSVDEFLMTKYVGDLNLTKRLGVGRIFSNEPGGIVRYSKM